MRLVLALLIVSCFLVLWMDSSINALTSPISSPLETPVPPSVPCLPGEICAQGASVNPTARYQQPAVFAARPGWIHCSDCHRR